MTKDQNKETKRHGRGPARSMDERVAAMEAQLPKLRRKAEEQLLRAADQARLFDFSFTAPQLRKLLEDALASEPRPFSVLRRHRAETERLRNRQTKNARADMARTKALLGAFMVAQWRHKSDLHGELAPDLRDHLASHPKPDMAQANIAFMAGLLDDPARVDKTDGDEPDVAAISPQQLRRNRSRRMILVGSWVLDRRGTSTVIDALIRDELANFLEQDRVPDRNIALLRETLGAF